MTHTLRLLAKMVLLPMCISISSAAYAQTGMMCLLRERLAAGFKKLETACGEDVRNFAECHAWGGPPHILHASA